MWRQELMGCPETLRSLREEGWWSVDLPEPNLLHSMDLAALGTIADVVPLVDEIFSLEEVSQAHQLMEASGHFGKIVLQVDPTVAVH